MLGEKVLEKEEIARRMEEQRNKAFRPPPRRYAKAVPSKGTRTHSRSDAGPDEQARSRDQIHLASTCNSEQQRHTQSSGRSVEGTSTASWIPAAHLDAANADAAGSTATDGRSCGVAFSSLRRPSIGVRRDATKNLARKVTDGSTSERRRLRDNLWVWLQLQDEEATELVPRQVQSWLTGTRTQ